MNGIWHPKTSSRAIEPGAAAAAVLILFTVGAALVYSRIGDGLHLGLPGHQGLIRVAIMLIAARGFGLPWSATAVAAGAGTAAWYSPAGGFDPVALPAFLLCGLVIDLSLRAAPAWRGSPFFLAAVGAAANVTKPLMLWSIAAVAGIEFKPIALGLAYPLLTYLAFGAGAGLIAAGTIRMLTRRN